MSNNRTKYNKYSNNIRQNPGFFGWIWIVMQSTLVFCIMISYLVAEFLYSNIKYFMQELRTHTFVTLAKYCVFLFIMFVALNIVRGYIPHIDIRWWMIGITLIAPFVVRFYIFDMCSFRAKKLSDIEKE